MKSPSNIRRKDEPRVWSFEDADLAVPVPENIPAPSRSNALPFRAWFDKWAPAALEGKQPHLFLPHAYWVEGREVPAEKATDSYARTKVRDQFTAWKKDEANAKFAKLNLVVIPRTGNEDIEGIDEPGISFWLTKAT